MEKETPTTIIIIAVTATFESAGTEQMVQGTPTAISTVAIASTEITQITKLASPSSPLPTPQENYPGSCILIKDGYIRGTVTHAGTLVPDGTFVSLVFEGGPLQKARTKSGFYSLPLLALQCEDGSHWVPFVIWAGLKSQAVYPDRSDFKLNLEAPEISLSIPTDTPTCDFVLGTVQGEVTIKGIPASDDTMVLAKVGPGSEKLTQKVFTVGGRYKLNSLGTNCEDTGVQFLALTLSVLGANITITPSQDNTLQNIAVP
ncbi:MAG: hypothetical protein U0401_00825 [Anaerolineae bacterium]